MTDVFLSYSQEDRAVVSRMAQLLEERGYSVWWDIELLPGDRFRKKIEYALRNAKAVVVTWSQHAIESDFVEAEAETARSLGKLIQLRTPTVELSRIPIPFGNYQISVIDDGFTVLETLELALRDKGVVPTRQFFPPPPTEHKVQPSSTISVASPDAGRVADDAGRWDRSICDDPLGSLKQMYAELRREAHRLLAVTGWHGGLEAVSISHSVKNLEGSVQGAIFSGIDAYLIATAQMLKGDALHPSDATWACKVGFRQLEALRSIPNQENRILVADVPLFSDSACLTREKVGSGLMLATNLFGENSGSRGIFPTTKVGYQVGQRVAWEWKGGHSWGPSWYKDPLTGQIAQAWGGSAEFTGRHLDEIN